MPENNSGRECCWPYLIGQNLLSPVLGQKQPGAPDYSYTLLSFHPFLAIICSVFGHFMFLSGGLLDYANSLNTGHKNDKQQNFAQVTDAEITTFSHTSINILGANYLSSCLSGGYSKALLDALGLAITPAQNTK